MKALLLLLASVLPPFTPPPLPKYSMEQSVWVQEGDHSYPGKVLSHGKWDVVYKQHFYQVIHDVGPFLQIYRQPESHLMTRKQQ